MKRLNIYMIVGTLALACSAISCEKFLDAKPSRNLILPSSLQDYRDLLNFQDLINIGYLAEVSSDDYYIPSLASFQPLGDPVKNAYLWAPEVWAGNINIDSDWSRSYQTVYYANSVIDGLEKIGDKNSVEWKQLKGWAHFLRGFAYSNLASVFCPPYDAQNPSPYGLPLKRTASITEALVRSSVQQTYDEIVSDLQIAVENLTADVQAARNIPNRPAAYALLARVYLNMRSYDKALDASTRSLSIYNKLINYNTLSLTSSSPFTQTNDEVLLQGWISDGANLLSNTTSVATRINQGLYDSYAGNDLRKSLYYRLISGVPAKKGSYTQRTFAFGGLATDEVYLIKAECLARAGRLAESLAELNMLLVNRFATGTFVPVTATSKEDLLARIWSERRKELVYRGIRWQDLRRLNKEGAGISITRVLDSKTYTLAPNSQLYTLPIPTEDINLSGMVQNPR